MGGLKLGKEAQAKYDEARIQPDIEGFLEKKGAKRKNWNTRWFVLKDNYLFYSKDNKTNPQGIINSHGCTVCKLEGVTVRPYSFSLLAPKSVSIDAKWTNRTYYLAAKDAKEMERWMKILDESGKKAMENAKKKQEAASQPAPAENNNKEAKEDKEKSEKKDKEARERRKKKKHSKKKKVVKKDSDSEDSDDKNDRDASDEAEHASENDKSGSEEEKKREDSYSYSEDEKDSEDEKKKKKKKKKTTKKSSSSKDVKEGEGSGTPSSDRKKKKSSSKKKKEETEESESESESEDSN